MLQYKLHLIKQESLKGLYQKRLAEQLNRNCSQENENENKAKIDSYCSTRTVGNRRTQKTTNMVDRRYYSGTSLEGKFNIQTMADGTSAREKAR